MANARLKESSVEGTKEGEPVTVQVGHVVRRDGGGGGGTAGAAVKDCRACGA